jgi:hypothetical protein
MPNTCRAALATLINLSLITAAFAQSNSLTPTPVRASAAEEESLRTLTAEYGRALASGDLEAVRKFWNPQSANLSPILRNYKKVFAQTRLEFITPEITELEITGDKAVSQLTVDERRLDKKTGAVMLTFDPFHGASRTFEWKKTDAGWRIEREVLVQDELAVKLEAARSDEQRDQILEQEKRFVNNTLVFALGTRALRHRTGSGSRDCALTFLSPPRSSGRACRPTGDSLTSRCVMSSAPARSDSSRRRSPLGRLLPLPASGGSASSRAAPTMRVSRSKSCRSPRPRSLRFRPSSTRVG